MADMNIRYEELLAHRKGQPALPTAVVHPCSEDALIGAVEAAKAGLIAPLLVGPKEQIGKIAAKSKIDLSPYEIVPTADAEESASVAANLAGSGKAGALMKGSLHTDQYMHAVLQRENGLRTSRLLSHCMLIAAPAYSRTIVVSDAAVNIAPGSRSEARHCAERYHPGASSRHFPAQGGSPCRDMQRCWAELMLWYSPPASAKMMRSCAQRWSPSWPGWEKSSNSGANDRNGPRISTADSKVSVWVIPTNEELMIARHTATMVKKDLLPETDGVSHLNVDLASA